MRVVWLLGALCVVFAIAHGQQEGDPNSTEDEAAVSSPEDDNFRGGVVYTPHDMSNVFIVRRSVGEDPGPQDDSSNEEDDDYNYGRVVHRPSDRKYPSSGGSVHELRNVLRGSQSGDGTENTADDDYVYGKVINSPDERTQVDTESLDILRRVLADNLGEPLNGGSSKEPISPEDQEKLKFANDNMLYLFKNALQMVIQADSIPDIQTNPENTGMMDSVLRVGNDMHQMYARIYKMANATCEFYGY